MYIYYYTNIIYNKIIILCFREPASLFILRESVAFICLDKESVQRCEIYFEPDSKPLVKDLALFNCYWKDSQPIYYIVNGENKIDIFCSHSTILLGINEIPDKIKCGSFSLGGNYLVLATENGNLYFYHYKNKKVTNLKICEDEIKLIKCFGFDVDDIVNYESGRIYGMVVASSSSKIVIIVDSRVKIEFDILDKLSDVYYLRNHLIVIDINGKLSTATITGDWSFGLMSTKYTNVTLATTHKLRNLLAIVCNEFNFYILRILTFASETHVTPKFLFETKLQVTPTCISLSSSGKLVAVGGNNGDIEVRFKSIYLSFIKLFLGG